MRYRGWASAEPRMRTSSGADMILREDARTPTGPTRRSVLALIGSLAPAAAFAAYPDRPIKLVVALAPGGPADTAARLFAPYFSERLGQSVVIENRTGRRASWAPSRSCGRRLTATRSSSARARASRSIQR